MKKIYRHRLALLLGILIAIVFFYLGVNKWIETQQSMATAPPSIARAKEPIQIKREAEPVNPETEEIEEETGEVTVALPEMPAVQASPTSENVQQESEVKGKQESTTSFNNDINPNNNKRTEKRTISQINSEQEVIQKEPKIIIRKPKKEFIIQIGAFKERKNARKISEDARRKGFDSFVIEEEGLFKVRVRISASSAIEAVKSVRTSYSGAFVVK